MIVTVVIVANAIVKTVTADVNVNVMKNEEKLIWEAYQQVQEAVDLHLISQIVTAVGADAIMANKGSHEALKGVIADSEVGPQPDDVVLAVMMRANATAAPNFPTFREAHLTEQTTGAALEQLKALENLYSRCADEYDYISDHNDQLSDLRTEIEHIIESNPEADWATVVAHLDQKDPQCQGSGEDAYITMINDIINPGQPGGGWPGGEPPRY